MSLFRLATVRCSAFAVWALFLTFSVCSAQSASTAYKTADISVFGGYLNLDPGFGQHRDNGFAAGIDYTRFFHFPVAPSFEVRTNIANGAEVNEKSYLVGLRAAGTLHTRFHPYADLLVGKGTIHYKAPDADPIGDNSLVYSYGGGLNYDFSSRWQLKLDAQGQHWRPGVNVYYYPVALLFGVNYTIPFKRLNSTRTLR